MWIWFGRPIEPWPNWAQMQLPLGAGYGHTHAGVDELTAAHDPALDVDELAGLLHDWSRLHHRSDAHGVEWYGHVSFYPPVHGEGISLSAYLAWFPATRLRPRQPR